MPTKKERNAALQKVVAEVESFVEWLKSKEAQEVMDDKDGDELQVRRWIMMHMLDQQRNADGRAVSMLLTTIFIWAAEQGLPAQDPKLGALSKLALDLHTGKQYGLSHAK